MTFYDHAGYNINNVAFVVWSSTLVDSIVYGSLNNGSTITCVQLGFYIIETHIPEMEITIWQYVLRPMVCLLNKPKPYDHHKTQTCYLEGNVWTYAEQIPLLMPHIVW